MLNFPLINALLFFQMKQSNSEITHVEARFSMRFIRFVIYHVFRLPWQPLRVPV